MVLNETELLEKVKDLIGITTDDAGVNSNIKLKILAVKGYLIKGGAKHLIIEINETDITCIAIGVNDLLNGIPGETKFSPAFNIFALQICRG
jgi:hypothetical protein